MRAKLFVVVTVAVASIPTSATQGRDRFVPNLLACTQWSEVEGFLYSHNACDRMVTVYFTTLDEKWQMVRTFVPGQSVKGRVKKKTAEKLGWISATCPAGFKPTVSLAARNRLIFQAGDYNCVRN